MLDVAGDTMPIAVGDEYAFGAPRVGSNDYAQLNADLVGLHDGQSWRIVNDQDIVPQVPLTKIPPQTEERLEFHHIDNEVQIFPAKAPQALPSEVGGPKPYDIKNLPDLITAILQSLDHSKPMLFRF